MNVGIPHGIMLHHFSSEKHITGQGAITGEELKSIIKFYGKNRLVSANTWLEKAKNNTLNDEICLTFDDALLSQYEVALPILESYGLTAFWFIYSSVLEGQYEILEIYRKYRTSCFPTITDFYNAFFKLISESKFSASVSKSLRNYNKNSYLKQFSFYSDDDRKFRYIRDVSLGTKSYTEAMALMLKKDGIDISKFSEDLWLNKEHVVQLAEKGHVIGLHSHTHPTALSQLPASIQEDEYKKNNQVLSKLANTKISTVAHPNNSYNQNTLQILENLGVKVGFCSNMSKSEHSSLEFPREDHSNIIKAITK
jgi:peptidoglycan/xylan/chitin deacetylase (PgdA/CDA1 family)